MEIRLEDKNASPLRGIEPVLNEIEQRLHSEPEAWLKQLQSRPGSFMELEKAVHRTFQQMADQVVAGLLAQTTAPSEFADAAKKKVVSGEGASGAVAAPSRRRSGEKRPLRVRLLGGLILWVTTLYFAPVSLNAKTGKTRKGRGREGGGLYPELGVLGIQEGKSPALVYDVGRLTALLPSYAMARDELAERGVPLNVKVVRGIGRYAGQAALTYRYRELMDYRAGTLEAGDGRGKRFGVMTDGGRTKLRRTTRKQKGQGKAKTQKRRFRTDWREPKVIIVFEMDEHGQMKKGTKPIIDGTFAGPDEIMEVLAMRLHQVGAAQASVVAFRSDGAPWIWDRLEWVIRRVGLKAEQVSQALDWCHAVHHISLALEPLLQGAERTRVFRTDIDYLERHGKAGHLNYATFRRRGLPLGSGAIESTIRRVINLPMKGNRGTVSFGTRTTPRRCWCCVAWCSAAGGRRRSQRSPRAWPATAICSGHGNRQTCPRC